MLVHLLLICGLLIELLNMLNVREHACLAMGQRALILWDQSRLYRVVGEASDILALHAAEVEVIASTVLHSIATFTFRWGTTAPDAFLRRWLRAFRSLFLVQYYRVALVKWDFDRIFDVEIIVFARHSRLNLIFPAGIEVGYTLLLRRKSTLCTKWTKVSRSFQRLLV